MYGAGWVMGVYLAGSVWPGEAQSRDEIEPNAGEGWSARTKQGMQGELENIKMMKC